MDNMVVKAKQDTRLLHH